MERQSEIQEAKIQQEKAIQNFVSVRPRVRNKTTELQEAQAALLTELNSAYDKGLREFGSKTRVATIYREGVKTLADFFNAHNDLEKIYLRNLAAYDYESRGVKVYPMQGLFEAIENSHENLEVLEWDQAQCNEINATALAELIKKCHGLKHIRLTNLQLDDDNLLMIINALNSCTQLETLDLSSNHINTKGLEAIVTLSSNDAFTNLRTIEISNNDFYAVTRSSDDEETKRKHQTDGDLILRIDSRITNCSLRTRVQSERGLQETLTNLDSLHTSILASYGLFGSSEPPRTSKEEPSNDVNPKAAGSGS